VLFYIGIDESFNTSICLQHSSSKYGAFEEFGDNTLHKLRKLHVEAQNMVERGKR
jgi:hypothetical protein